LTSDLDESQSQPTIAFCLSKNIAHNKDYALSLFDLCTGKSLGHELIRRPTPLHW
jgi:hypothetical protein